MVVRRSEPDGAADQGDHRRGRQGADGARAADRETLATPSRTIRKVDLLFVPGAGDTLADAIGDRTLHEFLRQKAKHASYVTSVCTGGLVLAAAGLLDGYQATCHWSVLDCLKLFPKVTVVNGFPRYLRDRNRFTGGGISSSIDEALFMVQQVVAELSGDAANGDAACQRVQLAIQYNPKPAVQGRRPGERRFFGVRAGRGAGDARVPRGGVHAVRGRSATGSRTRPRTRFPPHNLPVSRRQLAVAGRRR